jgi:hypothetical protein
MPRIAKRVGAALAALLGIALAGFGLWLAAQVGPSGKATFEAAPATSGSVLLTPEVLNRVDADVTVTAVPVSGGTVWMGSALPSDAKAIVGETSHAVSTRLETSDWSLRMTSGGTGAAPALATADIWRETVTGPGRQELTVAQSSAPESVVITTDKGAPASVRVTLTHRAWFVQALVGVVVGLALLLGALLLWRSSRRDGVPEQPAKAEDAERSEPASAEPEGHALTEPEGHAPTEPTPNAEEQR